MTQKIDRKVKLDAIIMDASGTKQMDIVSTLGISKTTLARVKRKLKVTGDIENGTKKHVRKSNLDNVMKNILSMDWISNVKVLLKMVFENPHLQLNQHLEALEERYHAKGSKT